ncbi:TRAP transporter small permease [Chryseomicrobium imtechense]
MGVLKWITRILGLLAVLCLTGLIIVVSLQILSRYLPLSYVWTEELTRYLFLYAIAFAAPLALLRNEYINVDLIVTRFSETFRRYYDIGVYVTIALISALLIKEGWTFVEIGRAQMSATMPIRMSVIHASLFIMGIFLLVMSLVRIGFLFKNKKNPYETTYGGEL